MKAWKTRKPEGFSGNAQLIFLLKQFFSNKMCVMSCKTVNSVFFKWTAFVDRETSSYALPTCVELLYLYSVLRIVFFWYLQLSSERDY